MEWNNPDMKIRKANSLMPFENSLLRAGRPTAIPTYSKSNWFKISHKVVVDDRATQDAFLLSHLFSYV